MTTLGVKMEILGPGGCFWTSLAVRGIGCGGIPLGYTCPMQKERFRKAAVSTIPAAV